MDAFTGQQMEMMSTLMKSIAAATHRPASDEDRHALRDLFSQQELRRMYKFKQEQDRERAKRENVLA